MANQGLASIGIDVKVNSVSMNYVTDIGDIGGAPSNLEVTCLKDVMKHYIPGVQDTGSFEVTYLFDNSAADSDFRVLKALQKAGNKVPVEVTLPDGTIFKNEGYVSTYTSGVGRDAVVEAKLIISVQKDWETTDPT